MNAYKGRTRILVLLMCMSIPNLAMADTGGNNTNSNSDTGPQEYTITAIAVLTGMAIYAAGTYTFYKVLDSTSGDDEDDEFAAREFSRYLRKNHGSITRDVLTSRGLFWETWHTESNMTPAEAKQLQHYFDGSAEQSAMLDALNSELTVVETKRFAASMLEAAHKALGTERFKKMIEVSLARHRAKTTQQG